MGKRIRHVVDYCDNGTLEYRYLAPELVGDTNLIVGFVNTWSVHHTDLTAWNEPYIAGERNSRGEEYAVFGLDNIGAPQLVPPSDRFPRLDINLKSRIRVFNHPACNDPNPFLGVTALEWGLLGIGTLAIWPIRDPGWEPATPSGRGRTALGGIDT